MGGYPDPARPVVAPEARPPGIARFPINPVPRNEAAGRRRRGHRGTRIDRVRRRRIICQLLLVALRPESGNPLPATIDRGPTPRYPLPARWRQPPEAAHPQEIVAIIIPGPVAWNPLNVSLGFLVGGHLIQKRRRLFGDDGSRLRGSADRLRISLMNGTSGQDFYAFILGLRLSLGIDREQEKSCNKRNTRMNVFHGSATLSGRGIDRK